MLINIDELTEGGRGIKIMSQVADELSYDRTTMGQNCLRLIKKLPTANITLTNQTKTNQKKNTFFTQALNILNTDVSELLPLNLSGLSGGDRNSPSPPYLAKFSLNLESDIESVSKVLQWYQQLEQFIADKNVWWKCQIALVEGFTNAVRHAHRNLPTTTPINLEIIIFREYLEIQIWDQGDPFDLQAKLQEIKDKEVSNP